MIFRLSNYFHSSRKVFLICRNIPAIKRLLIFYLFISATCYAQDAGIFKPDSVKKEIIAAKISGNIKIDGALDETEWKQAIPSPDFIQIEPMQGNTPNHKTTTMGLYNRQYLYLGIIEHDSGGNKAIRATDFRRDFSVRGHDHIAISLDGFNDHRNAMAFTTNAYGVQRDLLVFDDVLTDLDWDGLWKVRTSPLS